MNVVNYILYLFYRNHFLATAYKMFVLRSLIIQAIIENVTGEVVKSKAPKQC